MSGPSRSFEAVDSQSVSITASGGGPGLLEFNDDVVQMALNDHIVPVSNNLGIDEAVPVFGSEDRPLQTAIDKVANASGRGGVLLPPVTFTESDTVVPSDSVSILGWGTLASTINFTSTGSSAIGFHFDDTKRPSGDLSGQFATFDGFTIGGPGDDVQTGEAIKIDTTLNRSRFGKLRISQWGNQAINQSSGAITSTRIEQIRIQNVDQTQTKSVNFGTLDFNSGGPQFYIGSVYVSPTTGSGDMDILQFADGELTIQNLNVGGQPKEIEHAGGILKIGSINWEPAAAGGHARIINSFGSDANDALYVESVNLNAAAGPINTSYCYRFNGTSRGRVAEPAFDGGASLGANVIDNDSTSTGMLYEGASGDVDENSGGTVSPGISCLLDQTIVT